MTAPKGRFLDRSRELIEMVGGGKLSARVIVDQPYALIQHENLRFRHLNGGGAKYLERALFDLLDRNMKRLAGATLEGDLRAAMIDVSEDISTGVYNRAPWEFGDLRASGAPSVKDGGSFIYNRLPNRKRLTKAELRDKTHVRDLGLGN